MTELLDDYYAISLRRTNATTATTSSWWGMDVCIILESTNDTLLQHQERIVLK
jgi:hypothetical protein